MQGALAACRRKEAMEEDAAQHADGQPKSFACKRFVSARARALARDVCVWSCACSIEMILLENTQPEHLIKIPASRSAFIYAKQPLCVLGPVADARSGSR